MPLVSPRLTKGQTMSKSPQNNIFHDFISNPNSLEIFSNFDQIWLGLNWSWLLVGPRNLNFYLAIRISWNQFHWEDNQIIIPTTIHGSKLKLKRLRYWENYEKRISTLPKIITFDPIFVFLISLTFWSQNQKGLQMCIWSQKPKRHYKTNLLMSRWHQGRPLNGHQALGSVPRAINSPRHPRLNQNRKRGGFGSCFGPF